MHTRTRLWHPSPLGTAAHHTAALLLALAAVIGGCSAPPADSASSYAEPTTRSSARDGSGLAAAARTSRRIVVDGQMGDWAAGTAAVADEHFVYFRFSVEGEPNTIQAGHEPLTLLLDLDGDRTTGVRRTAPADASRLGVDLEITFSPIDDATGRTRGGVRVRVADAMGVTQDVSHADVGFHALPTYASAWYEGRISRHLQDVAGLGGLPIGPRAVGMYVLHDSAGGVSGWSDPFAVVLPPLGAGEPRAGAVVPDAPRGGVRVVSWNIWRDAPMKNSGPFARVLNALEPDVVLVQEWDASEDDLRAWFTALVRHDGPWHVSRNEAWGVAVVSRHPLEPLLDGSLNAGGRNPVRFAGARVRTPVGELATGSIHLKCCGSKGSEEDLMRLAEAGAINGALRRAMGSSPMRVIGGDLNLVGSRPPIDELRAGLDVDGGDLTVVEPFVLGDATMYTWHDADSSFAPGRLDYLLAGEAGASVVNRFVLDTTRLDDASLARLGLDRDDTRASDHLPLVVDIRPR